MERGKKKYQKEMEGGGDVSLGALGGSFCGRRCVVWRNCVAGLIASPEGLGQVITHWAV